MIETINNFIEKTKDLKVLVVGETIIDQFFKVSYEGQSMKSFCPVFKEFEDSREDQEGGVLAIANHVKDFVASVDLITNEKEEIIKTRFVDIQSGQKHIELNKFHLKPREPKHIKTSDYDVVIVADFGHGFCDHITLDDGFFLMCQTNSNNFGFNRVSKWKHNQKSGVCIDLREASLQVNKKIEDPTEEDLKYLYNYEINANNLFVTLGKRGSAFTDGNQIHFQNSFRSKIVDTIGAGDTYLAFTALLTAIDMPFEKGMVVPSLAASLSTTWLCNEQHVTKEKLLSHANKIV